MAACPTITILRNGTPVDINQSDYDPDRDILPGVKAPKGEDESSKVKPQRRVGR